MRIGVLVTSIGNFGKKGFYNSQEIGLAKSLEKYFEAVEVYKLVTVGEEKLIETIPGCTHARIHFLPSANYGINGILDCSVLDKELDALIYFADTQVCVPKVYRWCKKNKVDLFPYIGAVESHSTNKIKKTIINVLFSRNLRVFKKSHCFCKTPQVKERLESLGVQNTSIAPVGLDIDLLKTDYMEYNPYELKEKYGYSPDDRVLLFVGRFIEEKEPLEAIEIIKQLIEKDSRYQLLMVGSGALENEIRIAIKRADLSEKVRIINSIPNTVIWELYRFSELFLNLNRQEIFGMAILEAMYYGCKVVANKAPGPSFIIENNVSGYLCENRMELINAIEKGKVEPGIVHERIMEKFTWNMTANRMIEVLR